ncbi:unnamed protein product [Rangifer tarandus platyrhynchus]|uniref:Uncharacterized protein n=1 Tax=Rangifer tarandus platyrhynchus TaxID=3082113 RepID=A0AC59YAK2_RANTA
MMARVPVLPFFLVTCIVLWLSEQQRNPGTQVQIQVSDRVSADIATILRNDWAEQGTPHSPLMPLSASTLMAATGMGSVGKPRHGEGNWLCPVTRREAGCAETCPQPIRVQTLGSRPRRCFTGAESKRISQR